MKQRMVNVKFWDDTYIMRIDPIEKLLFLYLLTNPLTNLSGIYEISLRRIAFDTGIDSEMVGKMFKRFEKDKKIIFKNGWIWIVNFIKNQNTNPSIIQGIKRQLNEIPVNIHTTLGTGWVQGGDRLGELNLTKLNLTHKRQGVKPFFNGKPIIEEFGKMYVVERGGKMLFTGKASEIEWR